MQNKKLWDSVKVTDPSAVKPITGKTYKGDSPKPYWLIEKATETFGPIGIGWGVEVKSERFERMTDTEVLHVAVVSVWFVLDGVRSSTFDQMGGTKAAYMSGKGSMVIDEDAGKKSVTDGMVKCLSMIGFAGDIFSGMWNDSSYVDWAAEQYKEQPKTISSEQLEKVKSLASEVDADIEALLKWVSTGAGFEVKLLKDIPLTAYAPIIKQLEKKRTK